MTDTPKALTAERLKEIRERMEAGYVHLDEAATPLRALIGQLLDHIDATPAVTVGGGEVEKAHQWLTYLAGINDQAGSLKAADECRQWSDLLTRLSAKLQSGDNGAGCARRRGREP